MKKYGILLLVSLIFSACLPEIDDLISIPGVYVKESWHMEVEHTLSPTQGALYEDEYWVWARNEAGDRQIEIFDITNREKLGEIKIESPSFGWGEKMNFAGDMMYIDDVQLGIVIIDARTRAIKCVDRYDQGGDWWKSSAIGTYSDGYVYKALYSSDWSNITRYSLETCEREVVFEWAKIPDTRLKLSAPLAEEADGGIQIYNNLQLTDKSDSTPVNHSYFVNGHLDSSIDWIDTLDAVPQIPYDQTVPMFYGDDIIFVHGSKLISVKKSDGTINWSSEKNTGYNSKIVNKNGQHFVIDNFKGLEKFNPSTGKTIWHKNQILELNYDFELNDNKIVYSSSQFGVLVIRDGSSGDRIFKVDCITNFVENILEQAANPKYHVASKTFISHRDNEIFAFTIEDDN